MKYLYRLYQLLICLPILVLASILTSLATVIGCRLGNGHFWGYYPGKWWSILWIRILLLPVKVEGREHLKKNQSYVFVANHQGAFDIFLIYGFLGRNFKWMMKKGIRKIPLVGLACEYAHHIFIDKSGPSKIRASYDRAREHSFGIHVAQLAGMPHTIIKRANVILKALEEEGNQVGSAGKPDMENVTARANAQAQLSFFQLDDPVLCQVRDEILGIDVNNLTPLEALNKLSEIKKIVDPR